MTADDEFEGVYKENVQKFWTLTGENYEDEMLTLWLWRHYISKRIRYQKLSQVFKHGKSSNYNFGWKWSNLVMRLWFQVHRKCFPLPHNTNPECTNFSKCRSHLKILGTIYVTWIKFHTVHPQILGTTLQNLVTWDLCTPANNFTKQNNWLPNKPLDFGPVGF